MKPNVHPARSSSITSTVALHCPTTFTEMQDCNRFGLPASHAISSVAAPGIGGGHRKVLIGAFAALFACVIASPLAHAQASRTWVSGVGDDVNPCSRTAPGKTFSGAISKTASGGEINVIDPGGFGAVTVTKSITIDGEGSMASILGAGTTGITINAGATGVVSLRNLSINGNVTGTYGIRILAAAEVNIERCMIAKFGTRGISIECATPCRVNIRDTIVRDCPAGAIMARPNSVVTLDGCSLLASQYGFRLEGGASAHLGNCLISGNTGNGVVVDTSVTVGQAIVNLNNCTLTDNGNAGALTTGATSTVRLSNNTITGNVKGIATSSGAVLSFGNNQISGNTTDGTPTGTILLK